MCVCVFVYVCVRARLCVCTYRERAITLTHDIYEHILRINDLPGDVEGDRRGAVDSHNGDFNPNRGRQRSAIRQRLWRWYPPRPYVCGSGCVVVCVCLCESVLFFGTHLSSLYTVCVCARARVCRRSV